jgi:hypothetical protein
MDSPLLGALDPTGDSAIRVVLRPRGCSGSGRCCRRRPSGPPRWPLPSRRKCWSCPTKSSSGCGRRIGRSTASSLTWWPATSAGSKRALRLVWRLGPAAARTRGRFAEDVDAANLARLPGIFAAADGGISSGAAKSMPRAARRCCSARGRRSGPSTKQTPDDHEPGVRATTSRDRASGHRRWSQPKPQPGTVRLRVCPLSDGTVRPRDGATGAGRRRRWRRRA